MKYCSKCGTLLEDSHDICIGCGASVTEPGTFSLYPPHIEKSMQQEKTQEKKRGGTIVLLVIVFVLLVAAVTAFIIMYSSSNMNNGAEVNGEDVKQAAEQFEEETDDTEEPEEAESEEASSDAGLPNTDLITNETDEVSSGVSDDSDGQTVKDDNGSYYIYEEITDSSGNTIFSTLCPEDLKPASTAVSYDIYSTKFPERVIFVAANNDNNVKFTYMSPQHFLHRDSKNGKSRDNERNVKSYMQFLAYNKAQGYIEALIKANYSDIKNFKLVDSRNLDDGITSVLEDFSKDYSKTLATGIDEDYADIAPDTTYAAMASEFEASVFSYELTTRQNNIIYTDYYVPMIANTLSYASESANDMGNVIEWFPLEVLVFEAGNEELHDMYKNAFEVFVNNCRLKKEFFYDNEQYSLEIKAAVSDEKEPAPLSANRLKAFHEDFSDSTELSDFYKGVYDFSKTTLKDSVYFKNDSMAVLCPPGIKAAYYNPDARRVFMSPDDSEFPGSQYETLTAQSE